MKKTFKFFMVAAIVAAGFTGCSSEDVNGPGKDGREDGKEGNASIAIYDGTAATYAAGTGAANEEAPVTGETLAVGTNKINIYVYDDGQNMEKALVDHTLNSGNPRKSANFQLTAGTKYPYVFISQKPVSVPQAGLTAFEQQEITPTWAGNVPSIATNNAFALGTLWGGKTIDVTGSGTSATPESFDLTIGRAAAKVKLSVGTGATLPAVGSLKGTFAVTGASAAQWRLGAVPTTYSLVGQYTNSVTAGFAGAPPVAGAKVTSAAHNQTAMLPGDVVNPYYRNNLASTFAALSVSLYTLENTTAYGTVDGEAGPELKQYYGNTTYIQLMIKYTPKVYANAQTGDDGEVLDPATGERWTTAIAGTFWTAKNSAGAVGIYGSDPTGVADPNDPANTYTDVQEYVNGLNYYKFTVKDNSETDYMKNSVLRNHSYVVSVNSISRLGSADPTVDPKEPVEEPKDVAITVTVSNWSKIIQGEDL